ncbi:hypothetical protein [Streptomyces sp. NPDC059639]|uniref:hypothetical protein n=1 Tax=Streptomyces sp. NPDC059639 TaxID=3346891 RepID=UPI0036B22F4F
MDTRFRAAGAADIPATVSERLKFRVPPAFFELPVHQAPELVGEELIELAQDIYPSGNAELWFQYAAAQLPVVAEMMEAGVGYAGFCLLDLDGRHSTATVTATLLESVPDGRKVTASSIAAELSGTGDERDRTQVETVWLAAGEAAARFTSEIMTLPAEITDSGRSEEVEIGKIAVFLPLRRHAEMALFELSTPCMEDWDLYSELFFTIVNTLEIADAEPSADDAPAHQPQPQWPTSAAPTTQADVAHDVEVPPQPKPVRNVFG